MSFDLFDTNHELENEGSPLELGGDLVVYVRSARYRPFALKFQEEMGNTSKRYKDVPRLEIMEMALKKCAPQHLIARWEGEIRTPDGKRHTYVSPGESQRILGQDYARRLLALIYDHANNDDNYEKEVIEEIAGKLSAVSNA